MPTWVWFRIPQNIPNVRARWVAKTAARFHHSKFETNPPWLRYHFEPFLAWWLQSPALVPKIWLTNYSPWQRPRSVGRTTEKQMFSDNNHYNSWIYYQHTSTSLQNNIPNIKYTPNIWIHSLQNNIHVSKVHCGSAFEPGASGLPYCCTTPVCVPVVIGALWRQNIN